MQICWYTLIYRTFLYIISSFSLSALLLPLPFVINHLIAGEHYYRDHEWHLSVLRIPRFYRSLKKIDGHGRLSVLCVFLGIH